VLSGESRENHIKAARSGKRTFLSLLSFSLLSQSSSNSCSLPPLTVLSVSESLEPLNDWTLDGWQNACPIGAPLRNLDRFDTRIEERKIWSGVDKRGEHGLIVNHTETMDLCRNPEGQLIHGFTSW